MSTENTVDKVKLISELKEINSELFQIYTKLFDFKYNHSEEFKLFIDNEYKENGVGSKEKKAWNGNFCHRASYTLLNKILFVRICEDKGFMRNAEDYIAGEVKDPHIGEKLSKIGLQKWGRLITNYTLGELIKFAFNDMKQSYSNIVLYKEDKYEILNPRDEEFNLKYIDGDKNTKNLVIDFENVLNNIIEKLDTDNFNFKFTDGNILGDVYEKFMDRETRKAIGQFYTPEFVIEYILKNTVGKADVVENPFVTVADISCGSGHFLIMAYDILREKFLSNLEILREKYAEEIYKIKKDGKEAQLTGRQYWINEHIHFHILKNCIYGADIDSFAVQLTTINLLLKDLDNFTDELNIIECNSLVKWEEYYNWRDLENQLEEEFETVITTQTNLFGEEEKLQQKMRKENYKLKNSSLLGTVNEEIIDKEKAEEVLTVCRFWSTKFDYVVGNPPYFNIKRDLIPSIENYNIIISGIVNISSLFIKRAIDNLKEFGSLSFILPKSFLRVESYKGIRDLMLETGTFERIADAEKSFEDVGYEVAIFVFDKEKVLDNKINIDILEKHEFVYKHSISQDYIKNIGSFPVYLDDYLLRLTNKLITNNTQLAEVSDIFRGLPISINSEYLNTEHIEPYNNRILRGESVWYYEFKKYSYCVDAFDEKYDNLIKKIKTIKLVMPNIVSSKVRVNATLDRNGLLSIDTVTNLVLTDISYRYEEILGILNSKLMTFYLDEIIFNRSKLTMHLDSPYLGKLPIPEKTNENKVYFDTIYKSVCDILDINESKKPKFNILNSENIITEYIKYIKEIENIENEYYKAINIIDQNIYALYKLSYEEINNLEKSKINYSYYSKEEAIRYETRKLNNKTIVQYNEIEKEIMNQAKTEIDYKTFSKLIQDNSVISICENLAYEYGTVIGLKKLYSNQFDDMEVSAALYNLNQLYEQISCLYKDLSYDMLIKNKSYYDIHEMTEMIGKSLKIHDNLVEIMRKDKPTKKSVDIIKEALNKDSYTWNAYRKDKAQDKVSKTFVKYYDSNYYGLAEWSDEIHKQYFMDAIDEYTANSPNEKKAKDILKLFKELDIEDKEDYVDIIEDKIKKAFS